MTAVGAKADCEKTGTWFPGLVVNDFVNLKLNIPPQPTKKMLLIDETAGPTNPQASAVIARQGALGSFVPIANDICDVATDRQGTTNPNVPAVEVHCTSLVKENEFGAGGMLPLVLSIDVQRHDAPSPPDGS